MMLFGEEIGILRKHFHVFIKYHARRNSKQWMCSSEKGNIIWSESLEKLEILIQTIYQSVITYFQSFSLAERMTFSFSFIINMKAAVDKLICIVKLSYGIFWPLCYNFSGFFFYRKSETNRVSLLMIHGSSFYRYSCEIFL